MFRRKWDLVNLNQVNRIKPVTVGRTCQGAMGKVTMIQISFYLNTAVWITKAEWFHESVRELIDTDTRNKRVNQN